MSETSFDKTNLGWQLGQLQQRVEEWWELKTSQNIPNVKLPSWFDIISGYTPYDVDC